MKQSGLFTQINNLRERESINKTTLKLMKAQSKREKQLKPVRIGDNNNTVILIKKDRDEQDAIKAYHVKRDIQKFTSRFN